MQVKEFVSNPRPSTKKEPKRFTFEINIHKDTADLNFPQAKLIEKKTSSVIIYLSHSKKRENLSEF